MPSVMPHCGAAATPDGLARPECLHRVDAGPVSLRANRRLNVQHTDRGLSMAECRHGSVSKARSHRPWLIERKQDETIAPTPFGGIHRFVRALQQIMAIAARVGMQGDANACADAKRLVVQLEGL